MSEEKDAGVTDADQIERSAGGARAEPPRKVSELRYDRAVAPSQGVRTHRLAERSI